MSETPEVRYLRRRADEAHATALQRGLVAGACWDREAHTWRDAADAVAAIQRGEKPDPQAVAQRNARSCHGGRR